jgi:hypothetical protein
VTAAIDQVAAKTTSSATTLPTVTREAAELEKQGKVTQVQSDAKTDTKPPVIAFDAKTNRLVTQEFNKKNRRP